MIDKFKKLGEWKIHLTMEVNFMSSKDNDDKRIMHSKMIIQIKLLMIFLNHFFLGIKSMKGSEFVFDYVDGLHYKCNEINLNCGG